MIKYLNNLLSKLYEQIVISKVSDETIINFAPVEGSPIVGTEKKITVKKIRDNLYPSSFEINTFLGLQNNSPIKINKTIEKSIFFEFSISAAGNIKQESTNKKVKKDFICLSERNLLIFLLYPLEKTK